MVIRGINVCKMITTPRRPAQSHWPAATCANMTDRDEQEQVKAESK